MNYRYLELLGLRDIEADLTVTIDLNMADPISEIFLDTRTTNGPETNEATAHWIATVTKVEIVDGSDVLYSLDGYEMEALDIYHSGKFPRAYWPNYFSYSESMRLTAISFGRFLWDPILALDPKKFANPQLRITFDYDAGGRAPTKCSLSVLAALFDEKAITPTGFLMTKEVKKWTTEDGSQEYTDLPTDYPYRKLLIQSRYPGYGPDEMFDNIKLSQDQDKKVVLDGQFRDLLFGIGRENALVEEWLGVPVHASTQRPVYITPTMEVSLIGTEWDGTRHGGTLACWSGAGGRMYTLCETAANYNIHVSGYAPHGTLCIPFGLQNEIEDWYKVEGIGSLKLDITDGQDSGTGKIFIQQHRSY